MTAATLHQVCGGRYVLGLAQAAARNHYATRARPRSSGRTHHRRRRKPRRSPGHRCRLRRLVPGRHGRHLPPVHVRPGLCHRGQRHPRREPMAQPTTRHRPPTPSSSLTSSPPTEPATRSGSNSSHGTKQPTSSRSSCHLACPGTTSKPRSWPQRRASRLRSGPRNPPLRPAKPNGRGLLVVGKRAGTGRVLSGAGPGGRCEIFGQLGCERVRQTRGNQGSPRRCASRLRSTRARSRSRTGRPMAPRRRRRCADPRSSPV